MVALEESVSSLPGQKVVRVRRIHYVRPEGEIDPHGAIEFLFVSGASVIFDCGRHGQELRLTEGPWEDPWGPSPDEETAKFLEESGRPRAFDVSGVSPYSRLLGVVSRAELGHAIDDLGEVPEFVEITLDIGRSQVRLHTEAADDLFVDIDGRLVGVEIAREV